MFSKNLTFYRLKNHMTKKDLAIKCHLTPMAISNYESGKRMPNMEQLKVLASALGITVSDFLAVRNNNIQFCHGEFRKKSNLTLKRQNYIRESVEEYFNRFFTAVELLGGDVLPNAPACHSLELNDDIEKNGLALRMHLGLAAEGPIGNLISILENKGILVYALDIEENGFSGMNGFVNNHPYIIINNRMTTERNRSTISHELAHLFFKWPQSMNEGDCEQLATAIAGSFLFPADDALRELGISRHGISNDMTMICKEYGISMFMLAKRARINNIITEQAEKQFYIQANNKGWRTNEPTRIAPEVPSLFNQLVFRAVCEEEISIQKGAELLKVPFNNVATHCYMED